MIVSAGALDGEQVDERPRFETGSEYADDVAFAIAHLPLEKARASASSVRLWRASGFPDDGVGAQLKVGDRARAELGRRRGSIEGRRDLGRRRGEPFG